MLAGVSLLGDADDESVSVKEEAALAGRWI